MAVKLGVDFDPNTKKVEAALARIQAQAKGVQFGGGAKSIEKLSRPLGKITGQASEFQKSLEASNARVLAFGASVAVINKLSQAFGALVSNTIKVEASFAKINTILGGTQKQLEQFGNGIFKVAQNTATSFDQVAEGALELARQGLSVEESLSRVETALKLVRVAGIDSQQAVAGLTAAIKGFEGAGLNVAQIADKLAEVDTKFAVSTEDLINGLERASASARVAGVNFDELLGVITTVQERTQRGGAVIGNAFKTIFARLGRTDTLQALEDLGISTTDASGNVRSAIPLFQELATELDKLGLKSIEAGDIIQKVAGVRQRDILISLVEDLNSGQSQFAKALQVSAGAAGSLDRKNAQLNDTLEALINNLTVGAQKLSAVIGELGFTDAAKDILSVFSSVVNGITDLLQGDSMGAKFAQGIIKGIGSILTGPGLALISAIFVKLFIDLAKFGVTSLKSLLGINKASEQQNLLQKSIFQTLIQNEAIQKEILALEGNKVAQEQLLLKIYNQQAAALARVQKAAATVSPGLFNKGFRGGESGVGKTGRGAGGYVAAEARDVSRGVGGAPASSKVVSIPNFAFGGGKRGTMVANTSEYFVPNYAGGGDAIFNRDMIRSSGLPSGAKKINAAGGFIPNFAISKNPYIRNGASDQRLKGLAAKGDKDAVAALEIRKNKKAAGKQKQLNLDASTFSYLVPKFNFSRTDTEPVKGRFKKGKKSFPFSLSGFSARGPKIPGKVAEAGDPQDKELEENITNSLVKDAQKYAQVLTKVVGGRTVSGGNLRTKFSSGGTKGAFGALRSAVGSAFEIATTEALGIDDAAVKKGGGDFDIRNPSSAASEKLKDLFGSTGGRSKGEFKVSDSPDNIASFAKKIAKETGMASNGYIPNFARGLEEAVEREKNAGVPINQIRINQSGKLRNSQNPEGLAVTNTRDEPTGRIPNFAKTGTDGLNSSIDASIGKFFILQMALGGLTSSLTEQESKLGRFGDAVMGAVNTLFVLSAMNITPLGKAGGLGRAFVGGAKGARRGGAGIGGQLLAGSKGLGKSFSRIVGVMGKLRAVAGPVALGFTAVDVALKTFTGKGVFHYLGRMLGLVSTEAQKAAERFNKVGKKVEAGSSSGSKGATVLGNIQEGRKELNSQLSSVKGERDARRATGNFDEALIPGAARGSQVIQGMQDAGRLRGLSGKQGNADLTTKRLFGDEKAQAGYSNLPKDISASLQKIISEDMFANIEEIEEAFRSQGKPITKKSAKEILSKQQDALRIALRQLRDEAVEYFPDDEDFNAIIKKLRADNLKSADLPEFIPQKPEETFNPVNLTTEFSSSKIRQAFSKKDSKTETDNATSNLRDELALIKEASEQEKVRIQNQIDLRNIRKDIALERSESLKGIVEELVESKKIVGVDAQALGQILDRVDAQTDITQFTKETGEALGVNDAIMRSLVIKAQEAFNLSEDDLNKRLKLLAIDKQRKDVLAKTNDILKEARASQGRSNTISAGKFRNVQTGEQDKIRSREFTLNSGAVGSGEARRIESLNKISSLNIELAGLEKNFDDAKATRVKAEADFKNNVFDAETRNAFIQADLDKTFHETRLAYGRVEIEKEKELAEFRSNQSGFSLGLEDLDTTILSFEDKLGREIPGLFANNLGTAIKEAVTGAEDIGDALSKAGETFLGHIRDAFLQQAANQATSAIFGGMGGGGAPGTGGGLVSAVTGAAGAAGAEGEKKGGIGGFFSGLFGGGKKGPALGSTPASPLFVSDVSLSKGGAEGVLEGITGDKKGGEEEGKGFLSGLTDKLGGFFDGFKDKMGGLFDGIKGLFNGQGGGGGGGLFSSLLKGIGGQFTGGGGGLFSVVGSIFGFQNGGRVGFANGGPVGSTDTVPAMLTPGEFVVKRSAVDKYGTDFLSSLNNGVLPMQGFQNGGSVSPVAAEAGTSAMGGNQISNNSDFTFNIQEGKVNQEGGQSSSEQQKEFAARIRSAVTTTIQEESRTGGSLNYLYKG